MDLKQQQKNAIVQFYMREPLQETPKHFKWSLYPKTKYLQWQDNVPSYRINPKLESKTNQTITKNVTSVTQSLNLPQPKNTSQQIKPVLSLTELNKPFQFTF